MIYSNKLKFYEKYFNQLLVPLLVDKLGQPMRGQIFSEFEILPLQL